MTDEDDFQSSAISDRLLVVEAKQAVVALLDMMSEPTILAERAPEVLQEVGSWGDMVIAPLLDALDDGSPMRQATAAWMLLNLEQKSAGIVPGVASVAIAEKRLLAMMSDRTLEIRLWPAVLLSHAGVTDALADGLVKLLKAPHAGTRVTAAVALHKSGRRGEAAVQTMLTALKADEPGVIAMCLPVLAADIRFRDMIVRATRAALRTSESVHAQALLWGIAQTSPAPTELTDDTLQVFKDALDVTTKRMAIVALGRLTSGTDPAFEALMESLRCDVPALIMVAAKAIIHRGEVPEAAAAALGQRLGETKMDIRRAALVSLQGFGSAALPAMSDLIARVGIETDVDDVTSLGEALGVIGPAVVPYLVGLLRQRDVLISTTVGFVIKEMRPSGIRAVAEAIAEENNPYVANMLIQTLMHVGEIARPAVPVLGRILEGTWSQERACMILHGLLMLGPSGHEAIAGAVRCLVEGSIEVAALAQRVLWAIGADAVPALRAAKANADASTSGRIDDTLAGMPSPAHGRFRELVQYGNDDDLRIALLSLQTVIREGPMGPKALAQKAAQSSDWPKGLKRSENSIDRALKEVEKLCDGNSLIQRGDPSKGPLTREGRRLLKELTEYFQWKDSSGD